MESPYANPLAIFIQFFSEAIERHTLHVSKQTSKQEEYSDSFITFIDLYIHPDRNTEIHHTCKNVLGGNEMLTSLCLCL